MSKNCCRFIAGTASLVFSICCGMDFANDVCVVDGIEWRFLANDGKASICVDLVNDAAIPVTTSGSINVPPSLKGNLVTRIGEEAFYGCGALKAVTIPSSVKTIEFRAFYGCSALRAISAEKGDKTRISQLVAMSFLKNVRFYERP